MDTIKAGSMTEHALTSLSVLVVEDEPFTRTVVCRVIRDLGCTPVYEAADGVSALERLRNTPVDVVVCDMDMKPINGLDLLRRLRTSENPVERRLPLVFLTGRADPDDMAIAHTLGRTIFLVKPIQPATLRDSLARFTAGGIGSDDAAAATAQD